MNPNLPQPRGEGPPRAQNPTKGPLLLHSANLSWSQPTGALLVKPAPPPPPPPPPPLRAPLEFPGHQVQGQQQQQQLQHHQQQYQQQANEYSNQRQDPQAVYSPDRTWPNSTPLEPTPQPYSWQQPTDLQTVSLNREGSASKDWMQPYRENLTSRTASSSLQPDPSSPVYSPLPPAPAPSTQSLSSHPNTSAYPPVNTLYTNPSGDSQFPPLAPTGPGAPPRANLAGHDFRRQGPARLYDPGHGLSSSSEVNGGGVYPTSAHEFNNIRQESGVSHEGNSTSMVFSDTSGPQTYALPGNASHQDPQQQLAVDQFRVEPSNHHFGTQNSTDPYNTETQGQQTDADFDSPSGAPYSYSNFYVPVHAHWFFVKIVEGNEVWSSFSVVDSVNLEDAYKCCQDISSAIVPTDGGRYDVDVRSRSRKAVYWAEADTLVQRCTWFNIREGCPMAPYSEEFAAILEEHFREALMTGKWNQKILLPDQEYVIFYNSNAIMHYQTDSTVDEWTGVTEHPIKCRVVKRGAQEFEIVEGEQAQVDHLVFLVHGVGSICDFRFRSIEEVVDDFRNITHNLVQTHFKQSYDSRAIGRVELLPVSWHSALHGDETGIDTRLKSITLPSIPKLRHFSNDVILDALFYTSPVYSQTIIDAVGLELNRLFSIFKERNPTFNGSVALVGHSLGSLIVFDVLAHQRSDEPEGEQAANKIIGSLAEDISDLGIHSCTAADKIGDIDSFCKALSLDENVVLKLKTEKIDLNALLVMNENDFKEMDIAVGHRKKMVSLLNNIRKAKSASIGKKKSEPETPDPMFSRQSSITEVVYSMNQAGTGQLSIDYPQLSFKPSCFFAMGSPIPMFLTVRGVENLKEDYRLPTCDAVFNIFHPFDPIAYRFEPLIDPSFREIKPVQIPHHKGRKRMHLELKENLSRMGSDIKSKVVDSLRYTWNSIHEFARSHRAGYQPTNPEIEAEVERVMSAEMHKRGQSDEDQESSVSTADASQFGENLIIGQLNGGRRIDYVLQEKPIEVFNEYLFAVATHACYWESEDTALLILRELYAPQGIYPQRERTYSQSLPQQPVQLYRRTPPPPVPGSAFVDLG